MGLCQLTLFLRIVLYIFYINIEAFLPLESSMVDFGNGFVNQIVKDLLILKNILNETETYVDCSGNFDKSIL
jgi:hypothetical protein